MKRFPLWSVLIPFLSIVPLVILFVLALRVLGGSMGSSVTNEPEEGLARSLAAFKSTYRASSEKLAWQAQRFSDSASLTEALKDPAGNREKAASLCRDLAQSSGFGFLVLTDGGGQVLFDNIGLPVPTAAAAPSPKKGRTKKDQLPPPPAPSIRDWPVMERLGKGAALDGLIAQGNNLFLVHAKPLRNGEDPSGFLFLGEQVTLNLLQNWKEACGNDLSLHFKDQVRTTLAIPPPALDPSVPAVNGDAPLTLRLGETDHLGGQVPLPALDGATLATLVVHQPILSSPILTGSPREEMARLGLWVLLGAAIVVSILVGWFHHSAKRILAVLRRIQEGDYSAPIPALTGEWGTMADALRDTTTALREKQRISLVLGKVVSPQTAKTLLEERDLFALKGEKRVCTLLHADLRGFNDLSRNMEPPALVEALNLYFGLINEVVFKYEGMMDKFVGEAALAVWGAPFAHEDKEMRAIRAALEIQETLKEFNISRIKKGHPPFTVGIGIHTGPVVSGNLGSERRCDYTVIGEPLHVASRLCAMATPGQIVVSEETYLEVQPLVSSKPLNPLAVKGSLEPLKTFEITALL